jgi:transposase
VLKSSYYQEPSEIDRLVFEKLVPADHLLRQVKQLIDFESFRDLVRECYSAGMGRTAEDPVRMVKLEYLQFQYGLSDREVLKQVQVNVAFRYFLDLALDSPLPTYGLLSQFRSRLGEERHRRLFEAVVAQARGHGLIKDRLRLKDASHILANVAVLSATQLVAQTRTRVLKSAKPYAAERVEQEEQEAQQVRVWSEELRDEERLLARVEHLRRIVRWADELQVQLGLPRAGDGKRKRFDEALALAHRILDQSDDPEQKDRVRSVQDADARLGKHGSYYTGYQLDLSLDADSELITAVDTPPANQDEAANAQNLIEQEERSQGNDVAAISMDAIGFRGDILRSLQAPEHLGLEVYVPPQVWASYAGPYFSPADFHLENNGTLLVCPAEEETRNRYRNAHKTGWQFHFKRKSCQNCPLLHQCLETLPTHHGRTVIKNDYEAEYQAAWKLTETTAYAQVRHQHPRVERKFAEIMRFHHGRRTRYRNRWRVAIQYVLTALVVNIKRMLKLLQNLPGTVQTQHLA